MKVPDSITTDDIWMQRGDEILEGSRFKAMDNGWGGCGDWEYDDIHEVDEDEAKEKFNKEGGEYCLPDESEDVDGSHQIEEVEFIEEVEE